MIERERLQPTVARAGDARVTQVRLSPDRRRLAYVQLAPLDAAGVYVQDVDGGARRLSLPGEGAGVRRLQWSMSGRLLFYAAGDVQPRAAHTVGWLPVDGGDAPREDMGGDAFQAAGSEDELLLYAEASGALMIHRPHSGVVSLVGQAAHSGHQEFTPHLAATTDLSRVALVTRDSFDDCLSVHVYRSKKDERGYAHRMLSHVPGADCHAFAFWSPQGKSLGLWLVHPVLQRSGLLAFRKPHKKTSEGQLLYQRDGLDAAVAPVWSPSARAIAFLQRSEGGGRVMLLDGKTRRAEPITESMQMGEADLSLRFVTPKRLVIDGGADATVLRFRRAP